MLDDLRSLGPPEVVFLVQGSQPRWESTSLMVPQVTGLAASYATCIGRALCVSF